MSGPKTARLRPAEVPPILIAAAEAAVLCGVARSTWCKWDVAGLVPRANALGARRLWSRQELEEWALAGCPPRVRWEALRRNTA